MPSIPEKQYIEVNDFRGGISTLPFTSENQYYNAENLLISDNGRALISRYGTGAYDATYYRLASNDVIGTIMGSERIDLSNNIFLQSGNKVYNLTTELLGPTSNSVFASITNTYLNRLSYAYFNSHLYITEQTQGGKPHKIVNTGSVATYNAYTAGLPEANAIVFNNVLSSTILENGMCKDKFGYFHLVFRDSVSGEIIYLTNKGGGSWQKEIVFTDLVNAFIFNITENNGFIYILFINTGTFEVLFYTNESGSWASTSMSVTADTKNSPHILINTVSKDIFICWVNNNAGTLTIEYDQYTYSTSTWNGQATFDSANNLFISAIIDSLNNIHIATYDNTNQDLRYIFYDFSTLPATSEAVYSTGDVGYNPSIFINELGNPAIAFKDVTNDLILYVQRSSLPTIGGSWSSPEDTGASSGSYSCKLFINNDSKYIIFIDSTDVGLRGIKYSNGAWGAEILLLEVLTPFSITYYFSNIVSNDNGIYFLIGLDYNVFLMEFSDLSYPDFENIGAGNGLTHSYLYSVLYKHKYTLDESLGGTEFEFRSNPKLKQLPYANEIGVGGGSVSLKYFSNLSNINGYNYDINNLEIEIYRTTDGGTTFYYVGAVVNGSGGIFIDTITDVILTTRPTLYTTGGILGNADVPVCNFLTSTSKSLWYGVKPNKVYQSILLYPDGIVEQPITIPDTIVGMGSVNDVPVIFCKRSLYRIDGYVDNYGVEIGGQQLKTISENIGCINHNSIVKAGNFLLFASSKTIYMTDGFQVWPANDSIDEIYNDAISTSARQALITGIYNAQQHKVYYSIAKDNSYNDYEIVIDLNFKNENGYAVTTGSGYNISAYGMVNTASSEYVLGTKDGYILKRAAAYNYDKTPASGAPSTWVENPILYEFISQGHGGNPAIKKWFTDLIISCENNSNISIQPYSKNDNKSSWTAMSMIRYYNNTGSNDPTYNWTDAGFVTLPSRNYTELRYFPASESLHASSKQIKLENAYVEIYNNTLIGCNVNIIVGVSGIVTLTNLSKHFASDSVGYYISFAHELYAREYEIIAYTSTVLTIDNAAGLLTAGSNKAWKIKGYKKKELLNLNSYRVGFVPLVGGAGQYNNTTGIAST